MTPGKTGGYEAEVGSQSPEGGDTKELKYRCWIVIAPVRRGARGHNCEAPFGA
mgnify:CR=1 FL=1